MFRPLIVALAILANVVTAHTQGSTGGNVGKSDQPISGGPPPGTSPLLEKAPIPRELVEAGEHRWRISAS